MHAFIYALLSEDFSGDKQESILCVDMEEGLIVLSFSWLDRTHVQNKFTCRASSHPPLFTIYSAEMVKTACCLPRASTVCVEWLKDNGLEMEIVIITISPSLSLPPSLPVLLLPAF